LGLSGSVYEPLGLSSSSSNARGDPLLLLRAAAQLGIDIEAADAAQDAGLLEIRERCSFRHPLVRSAVYRTATQQERRQAHAALAEATDPKLDPDRRAWHRAQATAAPDDEIADELELSAARAQARGGLAAAAAFLERSVSLSADPARRAERALAAAQVSLSAGAFDAVQALLMIAEPGPLDELQRARLELLRAQLAFVTHHGGDAPMLLLRAAKRLEPLDLELARKTYLDTMSALVLAGRTVAMGASVVEVARAARAAPAAQRAPRGPDLMLDGLAARYIEGPAAAVPILRQALGVLAHDTSAEEALRWLFLASVVAVQLWNDEMWHALCERYVELGRQVGALSEIPLALTVRVYVHLFCGELDIAASLIEQMRTVVEATGMFLAPYVALHLAAMRGHESELSALIEANGDEMTRQGQGSGIALIEVARAILYNGLGRYDEALAAAQEVGPQDLTTENWVITERIEAAARAGRPEIVADSLWRLQEMTDVGETDWGLGLLARCRAFLCEGDAAESLYREAVERSRARGCDPSLPVHTCCTESGCDAKAAAPTLASSYAPLMTVSPRWEWRRSPNAPVASSRQPEKPPESAATKREPTLHPRKLRSPDSRSRASPTRKSAHSSSSARARSSGISGTFTRSSESAPAESSTPLCPPDESRFGRRLRATPGLSNGRHP
jgi:tetratricopeptide (TPR) repeat protein